MSPQCVNDGAAYVWDLNADVFRLTRRLLDSEASSIDNLGEAVGLTPKGALVGSPNFTNEDVQDQGAVLYFALPIFEDGFELGNTTLWSTTNP